jgi:3',5'-cyclic AMP phosphodiesterase CpdA
VRPRRLLTVVAVLLTLAGCGGSPGPERTPAPTTLAGTLVDHDGDGRLERGAGEPLRDRTELARRAPAGRVLGTFAQIADGHVADEESPARLEALDRLGSPFAGAFRPQEALSTQVLAAAVRALNRLRLDAVVETGDLVDGAQADELGWALRTLTGGTVRPDSGARGYTGVQSAAGPDPAYYRPDVDAPRLPGLLAAAQGQFRAPGLRAPWFPVVGNHELLAGGVLAPSGPLRALATGSRRIVEPPEDVRLDGTELGGELSEAALDDRPEAAALADRLLREGRLGRTTAVTPDARRRLLSSEEVLARLRRASGHGRAGPRLDYAFDLGPGLRGIVLDAASRTGGSGGVLAPEQLDWLQRELTRAGRRWIVVFSHQPLDTFPSGRRALGLLDGRPRVLAAVAGHRHRNRIVARRRGPRGYWLVETASLADFPQQVRVFRARATHRGAVLETWLVDTAAGRLPDASRELGYLDAQGGRPAGLRGARRDRNVRLFVGSG